jgi:hypothetical protein
MELYIGMHEEVKYILTLVYLHLYTYTCIHLHFKIVNVYNIIKLNDLYLLFFILLIII